MKTRCLCCLSLFDIFPILRVSGNFFLVGWRVIYLCRLRAAGDLGLLTLMVPFGLVHSVKSLSIFSDFVAMVSPWLSW